jgi:hypothetical protein
MEQPEVKEQVATVSASGNDAQTPVSSAARPAASSLAPQACPTCGTAHAGNGGATASYVYAIGKIEARPPRLSVEKEVAQAVGRDKTSGLTDRQALHSVLSKPENRYLVRQFCWVMTIEGLETYILVPRDPADFGLLVEALRPTPQPGDFDCVIGYRGPIAGPEVCNGLMVPIVAFDQIYSFDRDALIKAIPRPEKITAKDFPPAAEHVFDKMMQMADRPGNTDEDRALAYLSLRDRRMYALVADAFARNNSVTGVEVARSPLSGTRKVVDVIFSFTNRDTDVVEKFFTRVDVTDEFPFLVTTWSTYLPPYYYDR